MKANAAACAYCNGEEAYRIYRNGKSHVFNFRHDSENAWTTLSDWFTADVMKIFGKLPASFHLNADPRGYALKIDEIQQSEYKDIPLYRDWGGYGILAPVLDGN